MNETGQSPVKKAVLVIGVGNEFRRDDAAGLAAARRLAEHAPPGVRVLELSGEATGLLDAWQRAGKVIVVDAVSSGAPPGTVHCIEPGQPGQLEKLKALSTHGLGLAEAVELARAMNRLPAGLVIYGIEGQSFDYGPGLSRLVEQAVGRVVQRVMEELECTNTASPGI